MFAVKPYSDWLLQLSEKFPTKEIVSFNNKSYTAKNLLVKRNEVYSILKKHNISTGDRIAIISRNSLDFVIWLFAVWAIDAVPVPINIRQSEIEIIKQLNFAGVKFVFADAPKDDYQNIFSQFTVCGNKNFELEKPDNGLFAWEIIPDSTALLMFTSGSSGMPKCVEISFQNLIHSAESVLELIQFSRADSWLASLPFYHIGGFSIITRTFIGGNKLIIPDSISTKSISPFIDTGNANFISLVPTTLQRLLDANVTPHKSIKAIFLGGGRVTLELVKKALSLNYKLITVYGSTETASMIAADKLEDEKIISSFAGKPLKDTEYFIIDKNGNRAATSIVGEIAVKSPSVAKGYFNNTDETKVQFRTNAVEKTKYYLTNDLGKVDGHGRLFILGRKDDVIISGGENISTNEVTDKIKFLTEVKDAFVFGQPDEQWGEKLCAVVVLYNSSSGSKLLSECELKNKLKKILPNYKIPKQFFFIDKIPRTSLGKITKPKLLSLIE